MDAETKLVHIAEAFRLPATQRAGEPPHLVSRRAARMG